VSDGGTIVAGVTAGGVVAVGCSWVGEGVGDRTNVGVALGTISIVGVIVAVSVGVNVAVAVGVSVGGEHFKTAFATVSCNLSSLRIARASSYWSCALHQSSLAANWSPYWINAER